MSRSGARAGRGFLLRPTRPLRARPSLVPPAGPPASVSGPLATMTVDAYVGTPTVGSAGAKSVPGAVAVMSMTAYAGTPTTSAPAVALDGATATMFLEAYAGVPLAGNYVPGDLYVAPLSMSGLTGSTTLAFAGYTTSGDDPGTTLATAWFRYQPPGPGTLTLTIPANTEVFVREEASPDAFDEHFVGAGSYPATVSGPILICWGPTASATLTDTIAWSFAFSTTDEVMTLTVTPTIVDQTPTSVLVWILGAPESSPINVYCTANTGLVTVVNSDEGGVVSGASVAIPATPAGTLILVADAGSGLIATASIQSLTNAPTRPTTQPADAAPGLTAGTGVVKWKLFDPAPGGTTYTFAINPVTWSSPHAPKNVLTESSVGGYAIIWEAAARSHTFTFSGYLDSQADYQALESFRDLNHRHWLVDHRNRAWVVSIDSIDWQPKRVVGKPWAYNYSVRAQIYKGPVAL